MLGVILMEECDEVSHRTSKALRFGFGETQPEHGGNNYVRLIEEYYDLQAVMELLQDELGIAPQSNSTIEVRKAQKKSKVAKYMVYSVACGTLQV
jgi:hypothetical protein